ncbi:kinase-like domain-containing protein [Glomus cerebriforme]|uniref:Kinase-like domain-containing protein n=1 Tax=Glomus cerebriforme TaxID=658196 RepID=A0A397SER7_9GLOM|nr:kinase-like domain-containing protein [Glomus cerebriforme]
MSKGTEWITNAINNQYIQQYEYSEFKNITKFEEGRFAHVKYADWPCSGRKVAIKELKSYDVQKLVEEVKIHCSSHSSKHVVRFFGLTKAPSNNRYMMIMEYADLRSLRNFLSKEHVNISWQTRYKLSLDIAKGLYCLHSRNIAHCDLHTSNIVIKRTNAETTCCHSEFIAQITDFGGAISMKENVTGDSEDVGQYTFTDPKILNGLGKYKKDLRSDIYSLGVIFWEISSGKIPFKSYKPETNDSHRDLCLTLAIINGLRETPTCSTPKNYIELYKTCWEYEPSKRPMIEKIIETLETLKRTYRKDLNNNSNVLVKNLGELDNNDNKLGQRKGVKRFAEVSFKSQESKKVKV